MVIGLLILRLGMAMLFMVWCGLLLYCYDMVMLSVCPVQGVAEFVLKSCGCVIDLVLLAVLIVMIRLCVVLTCLMCL